MASRRRFSRRTRKSRVRRRFVRARRPRRVRGRFRPRRVGRRRNGYRRVMRGVTTLRNTRFGMWGSMLPSRVYTRLMWRGEAWGGLGNPNPNPPGFTGLHCLIFRATRPSDPTVMPTDVIVLGAPAFTPGVNFPAAPVAGFPALSNWNRSVANWDSVSGYGHYFNSCLVLGVKLVVTARLIGTSIEITTQQPGCWFGIIAVDPAYMVQVTTALLRLQQNIDTGARVDVLGSLREFPLVRLKRLYYGSTSTLSLFTTQNRVLTRRYDSDFDLVHDFPGVMCKAQDPSNFYFLSFILRENRTTGIDYEMNHRLVYSCQFFGRRFGLGLGQLTRTDEEEALDDVGTPTGVPDYAVEPPLSPPP